MAWRRSSRRGPRFPELNGSWNDRSRVCANSCTTVTSTKASCTPGSRRFGTAHVVCSCRLSKERGSNSGHRKWSTSSRRVSTMREEGSFDKRKGTSVNWRCRSRQGMWFRRWPNLPPMIASYALSRMAGFVTNECRLPARLAVAGAPR